VQKVRRRPKTQVVTERQNVAIVAVPVAPPLSEHHRFWPATNYIFAPAEGSRDVIEHVTIRFAMSFPIGGPF